MQPDFQINYLAILAAMALNIVLGFLWYGPIFGKIWLKEMGFREDMKPEKSVMIRSMLLMVLGTFLTVYILTHYVNVWRASVWNAGEDQPDYTYGFFGGLFTFVGFYLPQLFNQISWEQKSWKLFSINAAYNFIALELVAMIVSFWR